MTKPFQTIALIGKYNSPEIDSPLLDLAKFLEERKHEVIIAAQTAERMGKVNYPSANLSEIGERADLAVVFGGDGTMLNIARAIEGHNVPLVGINQGRLGFLTDISVATMLETMTGVLRGEFTTEDRFLLKATIVRDGAVANQSNAFNDVAVSKGATGRLIELEVFIDSQFVCSLHSDGVVVATPTGSTAYALSAGGPILHPTLEAVVLVPICPHTLSNRPIAINSHSVVEITVTYADDASAHFDGQRRFALMVNDRVVVRRSEHMIRLLHPIGHSYYDMLRQKLRWGEKL